jgi:hypothetical protein
MEGREASRHQRGVCELHRQESSHRASTGPGSHARRRGLTRPGRAL